MKTYNPTRLLLTAASAVATLCVSQAHATTVDSVTLQSATFDSTYTVYRDTGTQAGYQTPHWQRGRSFQSPVCYVRNNTPGTKATFTVSPTSATKPFLIKGEAGNYHFPAQSVTPSRGAATYAKRSASRSLPNTILPGNQFSITWYFSKDNGQSWIPAGSSVSDATSSTQLYATLAPPQAKLFHTVINTSCGHNQGVSAPATAVTNIWDIFKTRSVSRYENPTILTYWKNNAATATNSSGLLKNGNGQCGSWSNFFNDCLLVQGLSSTFVSLFPKAPANLMLVKNWTFTGTGVSPGTAPFVYVEGMDATDALGAAGQNNPNPPGAFYNHFVVKYNGRYYDPSYGSGWFSGTTLAASRAAWEDYSIAGFGRPGTFTDPSGGKHSITLVKKNTPGAASVETSFSS